MWTTLHACNCRESGRDRAHPRLPSREGAARSSGESCSRISAGPTATCAGKSDNATPLVWSDRQRTPSQSAWTRFLRVAPSTSRPSELSTTMLRVSTFTDLSQTGMDGLQSTSSFSTTLATRSSTVTSARTTRRVSSSQSASYRGGVATVGRASFTAGRLRSRKVNNVLMAVVAADSTWLEQCLKSNMNTNQLGPEVGRSYTVIWIGV